MADDADKTEEPTGKRLSEARNKGQVGKSGDFNSSFMLLAGCLLIYTFRDRFIAGMETALTGGFAAISDFERVPEDFVPIMRRLFVSFIALVLPMMGLLAVLSVILNLSQVGFLWTTEPIGPHFDKVFSLKGLTKMFSGNSLIELVKGVIKMAVVAMVTWHAVSRHYGEYLAMADMDLRTICALLFSVSFEVVIKAACVLIIIGIIDLVWQKRKHKKELRMSKQEVKDEAKSSEGDPHIKNKIKTLRMQMHRNMMMKELPKATVVITNPTFIAIAIRYRQGEDDAPVVVAKGKRLVAERIREVARENQIPIVEDKPLARGMFDVVEVGEQIPPEFFAAVAEILAYVYSLKSRSAA